MTMSEAVMIPVLTFTLITVTWAVCSDWGA
jgi:hypothetical protein